MARDRLYLVAFQILSSLLPSPDSPTPETYDFLPSPLLSALVELSTLPDVLTQLLRNDSVTEWQRRSDSPGHSPYAYGLFEFDIFLPLQYPPVNPVCWLKTTGGKKVRFNPNLYAEGKICLSLLGTWSGASEEMSQPGQSTIVQVLLSISLMISGATITRSFYNEPGMSAMKDDERNTTCWANLNWIKDGKFKASIWSDIIVLHFLLERSKLASTL
ncbi:baculoviral IAP repeat-containing protein 6 [Rhodotorula toruloides]|uniref:Baculoviral IAP repeat-containing protein 6 n=1 Tax=Rhodotorula toruloides TaxID=5286 RepID=A0A511KR34_RHOTO|nr:baculoviral IAP repeat-containing protein 6 [Rhodotorula toruloides]